jgi:hypothetical protein
MSSSSPPSATAATGHVLNRMSDLPTAPVQAYRARVEIRHPANGGVNG